MAKGRALIAAVALAVGLAGCASGTASTTDYSQGNQYTCDAVESNDDVSVGDAADGIAGLNRLRRTGLARSCGRSHASGLRHSINSRVTSQTRIPRSQP